MHTVPLPGSHGHVIDEPRPRQVLADYVELILALADAVHDIDCHRRKGEPTDERDEEAACRCPESTHVRVLLHGAVQTENRKLHRLQIRVDLQRRQESGYNGI